jgi:hypothetical protein
MVVRVHTIYLATSSSFATTTTITTITIITIITASSPLPLSPPPPSRQWLLLLFSQGAKYACF